jgi:S-adenosyl methyltransferase/Pyruvate ferredoxin/flavodoxin oxidoreductase
VERELLMTGIGGQGVQLAGQLLARAAVSTGRQVLMFGSYGGMMRGSYLVLSHITPDEVSADASRKAHAVYADATARAYPRTLAEVTQLFDGLELIEPGVVDVAAWHAEPRPGRTLMYGGVASKPR